MEKNLVVKDVIEKCAVSSRRDVVISATILLLGLSGFYITMAYLIEGTGKVDWLHLTLAVACSVYGYFHIVSSYFWWRVCTITTNLAKITGLDTDATFILVLSLTDHLRGNLLAANSIINSGFPELQFYENRSSIEVKRLKKTLIEVSGYYHVGQSTLKEIKEKQTQS